MLPYAAFTFPNANVEHTFTQKKSKGKKVSKEIALNPTQYAAGVGPGGRSGEGGGAGEEAGTGGGDQGDGAVGQGREEEQEEDGHHTTAAAGHLVSGLTSNC